MMFMLAMLAASVCWIYIACRLRRMANNLLATEDTSDAHQV